MTAPTYELDRDEAITFLTRDGGRVPCSRYGWDSASCAPVAYAASVILAGESGEPLSLDTLDYVMGLVVNDHPDPGYLIVQYGAEYGFAADDFDLDPADYADEVQS